MLVMVSVIIYQRKAQNKIKALSFNSKISRVHDIDSSDKNKKKVFITKP